MNQKKHSITAFDWTVCALALLFAVGILYFAFGVRSAERTAAPISYTVRIRCVSTALYDASSLIGIGNSVLSSNGTLPLGTVREVTVLPHRKAVVKNSKVILAEVPEYVDVDVTVDAVGTYVPGLGWRVSEIRIAAGERGDFHIGGYYAAGATLLSIKIQKEITHEDA